MEIKRYEVIIKGAIGESDRTTVGEQEEKKSRERKTQTNEDVLAGIGKGVKTTIGIIAGMYAMSQIVIQPIMREKANMSILTGDIVQAKNLQRINANTNKLINKGMEVAGIGATFMMSRVMGFVALGTSVVKEISGVVNRGQNNRMLEAQNTIDSFISSYDRSRMSDLIRG